MTVDSTTVLTADRRANGRRVRSERRSAKPAAKPIEDDKRQETPRRQKPERRRQIDPTTCERDYNGSEIEFMRAMDEYKRRSGRPFPTWSEVLEVLVALGYRKVADPTDMPC